MSQFSSYITSKMTSQIQHAQNPTEDHPPFITLSREYGCGGDRLSRKLCETLSSMPGPDGRVRPWKRVTHEVIAQAAEEIGVDPEIVREMTYQKLDSFLVTSYFNVSFSKYQKPSAMTVRNAIARVIINFAQEGRVIILGRGAASLTRHYQNSLHFRLQAPQSWRVKKVIEREQLPPDKAMKVLKRIDQERCELRNYFEGRKSDKTLFDIIYNAMTMTEEEITASMVDLAVQRGFIRR